MKMIRQPVRVEDEGYFGPDSVAWRLAGPTVVPALVYTGALFFLSPQNTAIGMENTTATSLPMARVVMTMEYMYAMTFGDRATADQAATIVNAMHDNVNGTWAPTGEQVHRASDPSNLLWLLIPFGQGQLEAYDAYGPRRLTREERDRFWREEVTILGELNRIPQSMLPKSQREADEYLEGEVRKLAVIPQAGTFFDLVFPSLLTGSSMIPMPAALPVRVVALSGIALLPDWAMRLWGQRPLPRVAKLAITAAHRPLFAPLMAVPFGRDLPALVTSGPSRSLVLRARAAARSGQYDDSAATGGDVAAAA